MRESIKHLVSNDRLKQLGLTRLEYVTQDFEITTAIVQSLLPNGEVCDLGSGFVFSKRPLLMTCFSVICESENIRVKFRGQIFPCTVFARDPVTDLALLDFSSPSLRRIQGMHMKLVGDPIDTRTFCGGYVNGEMYCTQGITLGRRFALVDPRAAKHFPCKQPAKDFPPLEPAETLKVPEGLCDNIPKPGMAGGPIVGIDHRQYMGVMKRHMGNDTSYVVPELIYAFLNEYDLI